MKVSKDTKLCISIAARPGNFGTVLFNKAFAGLELDYLYKAMPLDPDGDLEGVMRAIKALGIQGCGVSMPFKESVIPYLDSLDPIAKRIGAVNTIVNHQGELKGYNTDYVGAKKVLEASLDLNGKRAVLCGVGGVAKAMALALKELGADVFVTARNVEKRNLFAKKYQVESIPWENLSQLEGFLFVNCTPIGMSPHEDQSVLHGEILKRFHAVFDVVLQPEETKLIRMARDLGLKNMPGYQMAFEQAVAQFELYTGKKAPRDLLLKAILKEE